MHKYNKCYRMSKVTLSEIRFHSKFRFVPEEEIVEYAGKRKHAEEGGVQVAGIVMTLNSAILSANVIQLTLDADRLYDSADHGALHVAEVVDVGWRSSVDRLEYNNNNDHDNNDN